MTAWKRWPEYREAVTRIQSHAIRVNGCFVLGLDGHTPEAFRAVYDFALETELFDVQIMLSITLRGVAEKTDLGYCSIYDES